MDKSIVNDSAKIVYSGRVKTTVTHGVNKYTANINHNSGNIDLVEFVLNRLAGLVGATAIPKYIKLKNNNEYISQIKILADEKTVETFGEDNYGTLTYKFFIPYAITAGKSIDEYVLCGVDTSGDTIEYASTKLDTAVVLSQNSNIEVEWIITLSLEKGESDE